MHVRSFRSIAATLVALVLPFAAGASAQACPYTSVTTADIGVGVGFLQPPTLTLSLDAGACELVVEVSAPSCCNTYPTHHVVAFGRSVLFTPAPLGPPFLPGSEIFFFPESIGPLEPGLTSRVPIPTTASLAGMAIFAQAAPVFFTTIGFTYDLGVTQTVQFVLA